MINFDESELRPISEGETCVCMDRISIPMARYEQLLRAETELNVLGVAIEDGPSYRVDEIYKAIKKAREKAASQVVTVKLPEEGEDGAE